MFTGIIEAMGRVSALTPEETNLHLEIETPLAAELKIDQSIAHNGVCLTVVAQSAGAYTVTAIKETLDRTNLGGLAVGDLVNLERCTRVGDRLDGHIVQGHVDTTGTVLSVEEQNGSWVFGFSHARKPGFVTVSKGSVTINGVSLTVVDSEADRFSVAIIPYTFEHTNFHLLKPGMAVNLEFDIIGKYVERLLAGRI